MSKSENSEKIRGPPGGSLRDPLKPFLGQIMVKFAEKESGNFSKIAYLTAALGPLACLAAALGALAFSMLRIVFDICIPEIEKKIYFHLPMAGDPENILASLQ